MRVPRTLDAMNTDAPHPSAVGRVGVRATTALLAVIVLLLIVFIAGGDDDDGTETTDVTSTSIDAPTTLATTTTTVGTTTTGPTTTVLPAGDTATAVWPWVESDVRYADPVEAARGFALDFIGFTEPLIGEFVQGDSRSGEVEVWSIETFAPTTVFVRQLGPDDTWWVIGSATENIVVDAPQPLATIASPFTVAGRSSAFEGTVAVEIRADGVDEPIFESFVTGGGSDGLGPFVEEFAWPNPGAGSGAIVFQTTSSDDGRIWEAGVIRVVFADT